MEESQVNNKDSKSNNKKTSSLTQITTFATAETITEINNTPIEVTDSLNNTNTAEVIIEELVEELEIEYFTEGPSSEEIEIDDNKKRIIISSDIHYEDILAFTTLPIETAPEAVKLFWLVNDSKVEINTDKYDTNDNGLIDYIEWNVPSLSNQTYELSITILNVQSFPTLNGNWTVRFNTTGTGNLTIFATNGTTYSEIPDNSSTVNDLEFLELACDQTVLNVTIVSSNGTEMPYEVYKIKRRIEEIEKRLEELG